MVKSILMDRKSERKKTLAEFVLSEFSTEGWYIVFQASKEEKKRRVTNVFTCGVKFQVWKRFLGMVIESF